MLVGGGERVAGAGVEQGGRERSKRRTRSSFRFHVSARVFERFLNQVHGSRGETEGACAREPIRGYLDAGGDDARET